MGALCYLGISRGETQVGEGSGTIQSEWSPEGLCLYVLCHPDQSGNVSIHCGRLCRFGKRRDVWKPHSDHRISSGTGLIMKFFTSVFLCILLVWVSPRSTETQDFDGVSYEFSRDGNLYTFHGSFRTFCDRDCLLDILYDFDHFTKFVTYPNALSLLQKADNWYDFCCTYRVLLSENKLVYRKTLKKEARKVTFEMIAGRQNIKLLPEVLSSSGYFEIIPEKDRYQVVYLHQDRLSPSFSRDIYLYLAKKEAVKFLRELKNYVERECS